MLYFSKLKIASLLAFCLVFVYLALPSMMPVQYRDKLPKFLQGSTVNLGLDLRGGSHLLLQLDFKSYMRDQTENLRSDMRAALRKADIGYNGVSVEGKEVVADIKRETIKDDYPLSKVIREMDSGLDYTGDGNLVRVHYSDKALRQKQVQLIEQSIEIVGRRINESGLKEPIIQRQGEDRILLQVPGLDNPQHLKEILGKTAKMTFHLVNDSVTEAQALAGNVPLGTKLVGEDSGNKMTPNEKTRQIPIFTRVELSGEMLTGAAVTYDENNQPAVSFKFNTAGARKFGDITRDNINKPFAIVLDDKVITAPVIRSAILGGSGVISGNFTVQQANDLALLLRAGALPAPLAVVEERSVGPSLGADSIDAGIISAEVAFAGITFFMILCYGLFGMFSIVGLMINMIMILGTLSLFQATLTLPGIAGIILTMGMSVDANVLIFERIREEIKRGRAAFSAVENGFRGAQATIFDSNVTTLLAASILYYFGTGTVKGFAVTLIIGIISSMFSAVMLTRMMVAIWMQAKRPKVIPI